MTPEQEIEFWRGERDRLWYQVRDLEKKMNDAILREREAILNTLKMVYKEHCVSQKEAQGVAMAISCVEARSN